MSTDPLAALRAAAPEAVAATAAARASAYAAAVALPPLDTAAPSLRRWWTGVVAAVCAAVLAVAGTAVPAVGQASPGDVPAVGPVQVFTPLRTLSLTRPDGTVYTVEAPSTLEDS
ncbi:hypothetical protein [Cellulomonas edaphi]|uniref:Uncharacterized protein n=1 Tax=Cellulomonas edaphi TaxID=3053468 RepID=A0ABT7S550_9CELL|nr:hypothetical protein [Cellulomons edaphi]MDM7830706.1 hypothetical protein [Cellulomons edaphi]